MSVDDLAEIIWRVGHRALLAKRDIKSAYLIVPVHPEDRQFLGMQWTVKFSLTQLYLLVFDQPHKAVQCTCRCTGTDHANWGLRREAHYLDYFITVGSPESDKCTHNLYLALSTYEELGVLQHVYHFWELRWIQWPWNHGRL